MFVIIVPSINSNRLLPCLELLWTNMLSEMARMWPLTEAVVETSTCNAQYILVYCGKCSTQKNILMLNKDG